MFIGSATPGSVCLAECLGAERALRAPSPPRPEEDRGWGWRSGWADALSTWRTELDDLPLADAVVVCTWADPADDTKPLVDLDPAAWRVQVEWPTALWFSTLVAATQRCRDGGSVVAVIERAATLDATGRAPEVAVADGLANLVRSLAAAEGPRRVRVNAVTSRVLTVPDRLLGAPPPLATFPGRVDVEVAGAVRLLLSADAIGLTGTVLAAGCGR